MKISTNSSVAVIALLTIGLGIMYGLTQQNQNVSGDYGSTNSPPKSSSVQSNSTESSPINLSVKKVGLDYKWTNATNGVENPQLNLNAKMNNIIKIQNPTDTKHELIVDLQGKQVASSGDIAPGASGQVSFTPNGTGTFSYHCQYHPDTMKGTIKLTS